MSSDPNPTTAHEGSDRSDRRSAGHESSAFVVRFWEEPREGDGAPALRGYVKNLKTGREQYFSDVEEVPRLLEPQVGPERPRSRRLMSGSVTSD